MIENPSVGDQSLIYMYGISDFWSDIFGDTRLVESVLSAETFSLAEVYSYFMQRAAGISLEDIQDRYNTRIKLLLVGEDDSLSDDFTTFKIDSSITNTSKISNRPILPTQVLDNAVHYEIVNDTIKFARPLNEMRFPVRYTSEGKSQYALWMTDVEVDEKWIDNTFGRLVGFTEDNAIFNYKSFLEGVYYLYSNGPNIAYIERGVNLAMGMPYARLTEEILDITQDAVTGNWVVFTDTQSYIIPYGYRPELKVGDTITENEVLDNWIEIKDHTRNGDWWYDIYLPNEVLGRTDYRTVGKCVPGSVGDGMMQSFLKHHMFEVLITQPNGDISSFNTVRDLILYSKPEYTFPVFVWKVPVDDEVIELVDDMELRLRLDLTENIMYPISVRYMNRGIEKDGFSRGYHLYNRFQGSMYAATLLGYGDWPRNGGWAPEFSTVADNDIRYLDQVMHTRGDIISPQSRGDIMRGWRSYEGNTDANGNQIVESLLWDVPGDRVFPEQSEVFTINDRNMTPLYMLTESELIHRLSIIAPRFKLGPSDFRFVLRDVNVSELYDTWLVRNPGTEVDDERHTFITTDGGLDINLSDFAKQAYVPRKEDLGEFATLFVSKNTRDVWSVQWVRTGFVNAPTLFPVEDQDHLQAIEDYDYSRLGKTAQYADKKIASGQGIVYPPVRCDVDSTAIVTINDQFLPSHNYVIDEDGTRLKFNVTPVAPGNATWLPKSHQEEWIGSTGTDKYHIDAVISNEEDAIVFVSPNGVIYEAEFEYTISADPGGGSFITFTNPPAAGYSIAVVFADKGDAPADELVVSSGLVYTVQSGFNAKIFVGNRLLPDSDYNVTGTVLTLKNEPVGTFRIRYYPVQEYTLTSLITRGTVQSNKARFLMDRSRPDGEYDSMYEDAPNVFMNRSGQPWSEVPEPGNDPVYADKAYVTRRLL